MFKPSNGKTYLFLDSRTNTRIPDHYYRNNKLDFLEVNRMRGYAERI